MQNLLEDLKAMLQKDERFIVDGDLLKNRVIEFTLKSDEKLIRLLLSNKNIKKHFFQKIDDTLVFQKDKFIKFVNNKAFLPDSYTGFKNKIGLTTEDDYLREQKEVVISWPYKDCVLEGGQTKEEDKRNEVFWNEILAPDEIDRLLDPKVLTNFNRIDSKGEHEVKELGNNDNFIIRGNNLLVLHSLIKRFEGKIKLIYIDPPYNTGSDSFNYNDSFNHSAWLTFMKNRLEIAKRLLRKDGAIFVQIDHHELGYLNVLMDEIFRKENKVQVISIKTATPAGFKVVNPGPIDVTEYLLFYTKSKKDYQFKKQYVPVGYNKNYNLYLEKLDKIENWKFIPILEKILEVNGFKSEKDAKKKYGKMWPSVRGVMIANFAFENADNIVSIRDPHKPTAKIKELMEQSKKNSEKVIEYKRENGSILYLYKGGSLAFYSNKVKEIDGKKEVTELLSDFWNHISWAGIAKEGGVKLKNGKKPEKLIKQIIDLSTEKGDIVLDFHLGSGTTCAVAHKMGRQYIGVEQLDYEDNDSVIRLTNVIKGDQTGISKAVGWKRGGDFVYCKLKKWNQIFVDEIQHAKTKDQIKTIWGEMKKKAFLSYRLDVKKFDNKTDDFKGLSLEDQKNFLLELLDKNQLFVNLSEIDDEDYKITGKDKELNKQFYKTG